MSGFELAGCPEAGAAGVCVQHLQAPFAFHHHADMQAQRAAEHGGYGPRLRGSLLPALAQFVIGGGIGPEFVLAHGAQAGISGKPNTWWRTAMHSPQQSKAIGPRAPSRYGARMNLSIMVRCTSGQAPGMWSGWFGDRWC